MRTQQERGPGRFAGKLRGGRQEQDVGSQKSLSRQDENMSSSQGVGFPGGTSGKEPSCQSRGCKRCRFNPWIGKIPWKRKWQPTPVFLPGKSHGQRNLASYSPRVCKESNTTEVTQHMHLMIQGCRSERDETWRPQPPIELGPYRWKQVEDVMDS